MKKHLRGSLSLLCCLVLVCCLLQGCAILKDKTADTNDLPAIHNPENVTIPPLSPEETAAPTVPPTEPAPPSTEAPAPSTEPTEPSTERTEPPTEATEPPTEPTTEEPYHLDLYDYDLEFNFLGEHSYLFKETSHLPESHVEWTSSNDAAASVEPTGQVVANGPGTAVITARCGELEAQCVVRCRFVYTSVSLAPYAEVLNEYADYTNARFLIIDVDDDSVPELILSPDNFHMAPAGIYTIRDGQAEFLESCGGFGDMLATYRMGLFGSFEAYMDNEYYMFYRLSDGKAELVDFLRAGPEYMGSEEITYDINYEPAAQAEYEALLNDYLSYEFRNIGHTYGWEVTRENIDRFLADPNDFYSLGSRFKP